jgi:hypothetical protein
MSLRYIVAAACLYVAFYGVPEFELPSLPTPTPTRPAVDEPTKDLREAVAGVAEICERMQPFRPACVDGHLAARGRCCGRRRQRR